jgi:hypothetical protein
MVPGGAMIHRRFLSFQKQLGAICRKAKLRRDEATFNDFTTLVAEWLIKNP